MKFKVFIAFILIIFTASCWQQTQKATEVFKKATEVFSKKGLLDIILEPKEGTVQLGGKSYAAWMYNGGYIPPLLHLKPGDTSRVHLNNGLNMETNIHYHGFDVFPLGKSATLILKNTQAPLILPTMA